ncbi:hypothetical protein PVAP13_3KG177727 [Panicum virgatum]|uniref:Uncharacterized protein n=1 Tax=Panicum virgatum TaxID=38727 RepID=A0A8T0UJY7_PANVG|nr:hypothetical protein PVAP13_3KG177727 [Panicum virgatum]
MGRPLTGWTGTNDNTSFDEILDKALRIKGSRFTRWCICKCYGLLEQAVLGDASLMVSGASKTFKVLMEAVFCFKDALEGVDCSAVFLVCSISCGL